jgi:hypothetical protein
MFSFDRESAFPIRSEAPDVEHVALPDREDQARASRWTLPDAARSFSRLNGSHP